MQLLHDATTVAETQLTVQWLQTAAVAMHVDAVLVLEADFSTVVSEADFAA